MATPLGKEHADFRVTGDCGVTLSAQKWVVQCINDARGDLDLVYYPYGTALQVIIQGIFKPVKGCGKMVVKFPEGFNFFEPGYVQARQHARFALNFFLQAQQETLGVYPV